MIKKALHPPFLPASPPYAETFRMNQNIANLIKEHKDYRRVGEIAGKGGKQIERCVISTFQVTESMGFKHDFRQWGHLLRVGD
jgi:hypothetical protein